MYAFSAEAGCSYAATLERNELGGGEVMKKPASPPDSSFPLLLCVLYFVASCFWVIFTDRLLHRFSLSPEAVSRWSIVKGLLFLVVSSALIYSVLKKLDKVNRELEAIVAHRTAALANSEQFLHKSEERLLNLLANLPDVTWTLAATGEAIYISPNVEKVVGYTAEEILAGGAEFWFARIHGDDAPRGREAVRKLIQQGQPFDLEYRFRCKDGHWIWLRDRAVSTHVEGGVLCADGTFSDVSAHREAEEARWAVLSGALDGYYLTDAHGKILEVNDSYCRMSGYSRQELLAMRVPDLECQETDAQVAEHMQLILAQLSDRFETRHRRKDGQVIDVESSVTAQGNRFVCFLRDVTERKRAEQENRLLQEQLLQAQKMEAVGRLAGGIAHDFNNLLMVIRSYSEMLDGSLPANDKRQRYAEEILKATDRAARLTGQMLAFSRKQMLAPVVLDLNILLDESVKMLRRVIGEDIEVRVNASEPLWPIEADADQILQVLMNLSVNARDAMPRGGDLVLATRNVTVPGDSAEYTYMASGEYVMLSVTDTGEGMSKETQERIFEPFFTTKGVGRGTGLGLSTVYGIVKQSNGYVWCKSELGQGTTFTILLPRATHAPAPAASLQIDDVQRGTETVLVVEDEQSLRELAGEFLRSLGYTVLTADSGQQALSAASLHQHSIDVLLTDVVMPKMSGTQLSQMLSKTRPGMKTIYMSGYTDDAVVRHGIRQAAVVFLQKPFSFATLARKLREVIATDQPK
jgi:PAS domain S-box-containing protein